MSITTGEIARLRPFLYHLTSRQNLRRIKSTCRLESAQLLLTSAGRSDWIDARRLGPLSVRVDGELVQLRDQDPMHEGEIAFEPGWGLGRFVRYVNQRVFFWPGSADGPIDFGRNHFQRFASEGPIVLRVGFYQLLLANPGREPAFCRFNSGAPRMVNGRKSPRGAATFLAPEEFDGVPSNVVEVVFEHSVTLPTSTQTAQSFQGPWNTLVTTTV